jgi:malate dehydrogenase (oxaloacetate-decarboxylating)
VAAHTNHDRITGGLDDALRGADALVGVSGPRLVRPESVSAMADRAIVFALANPVPAGAVEKAAATQGHPVGPGTASSCHA